MEQLFKDHEYPNPSAHLMHCSVCGEAKELLLPVKYGKPLRVHRFCACERKENEAREAKRQKQEHIDTVTRLRSICFEFPPLRKVRFSNDNGSGSLAEKCAREYAEHFSDLSEHETGLVLWGEIGCGKTYLAACIANELIDQEHTVLMRTASSLISRTMHMSGTEQADYRTDLRHYDLLIIDDFGAERNTSYATEQLYGIINDRCESGKPMLLTTNLTVDDFEHPGNREYARICDRINGSCIILHVEGESRRPEIGRIRQDHFIECLSDGSRKI